jgi:EmrB/QacA subfamily drug resistance transporter
MTGLDRFLTEPARPDRIRRWSGAPWLVVAAVCVGAFMGQLDASIVTLALPAMRGDFGQSLASVQWVSLVYLLVLVGSVSAVGRIADVAGRKLLYVYGFALFTLASLGCALSGSLAMLLAMRVAQALGAALLQANSVALIRTTMGADKLNRAIGIQGAAQALGLALGPAVGGVLIAAGGWRWVFYVNLPAGVIGIALGLLLLPRTRVRAARTPFDVVGLALLVPATASLLLSLSVLGRSGPTPAVALLVLTAAILLLAFARWERRCVSPLVDTSLFERGGEFTAGIVSGLLAYLVLFGVLLVSPVYLEARSTSTATAGLLIAVLPLALGIVAPIAGIAADRFGAALVTTVGLAIATAGLVVGAVVAPGRIVLIVVLAVAGLGLGVFTPANNATVARAGRDEQAGMVSGLLNMTRGVGTSLGVALAAASFSLATAGGEGALTAHAAVTGWHATMLMLAIAAGAGALVCARQLTRASTTPSDHGHEPDRRRLRGH